MDVYQERFVEIWYRVALWELEDPVFVVLRATEQLHFPMSQH